MPPKEREREKKERKRGIMPCEGTAMITLPGVLSSSWNREIDPEQGWPRLQSLLSNDLHDDASSLPEDKPFQKTRGRDRPSRRVGRTENTGFGLIRQHQYYGG